MPEDIAAFDAVEVGVLAERALAGVASGRVAAVFDRSLYIVVQGGTHILPGQRADVELPLARRETCLREADASLRRRQGEGPIARAMGG